MLLPAVVVLVLEEDGIMIDGLIKLVLPTIAFLARREREESTHPVALLINSVVDIVMVIMIVVVML
jgi:hypothetical protein